MEKTLLIHCTQPFAQYRNPFTFYYAQTFPLPPKSTIIGMLQNATHRYYDESFWNLNVSVHGGFESVFWNYSNLIKGDIVLKNYTLYNQRYPLYGAQKTSQRTPVHMQEMYNGHLWIFLRGEERILNNIKASLLKPKKALSIGRSEDLIFIKNAEFVESKQEKQVEKNLRLSYPMFLSHSLPLKNKKFPVYSIPTKILFQNNGETVKCKSEITKDTERKPEFTTVIYTGLNFTAYLSEKITIEEYDINGDKFKIPYDYGWF